MICSAISLSEMLNLLVGDEKGIMRGDTVDGQSAEYMDNVDVKPETRVTHICSIDDVKTMQMGRSMYFTVLGTAIEEMSVSIFNLRGELVYSSGFQDQQQLRWSMRSKNEKTLANGVYFYLVSARGVGGQLVHDEVRKFVVLR